MGVKADTIASGIGGMLGAAVTVGLVLAVEERKKWREALPRAHLLRELIIEIEEEVNDLEFISSIAFPEQEDENYEEKERLIIKRWIILENELQQLSGRVSDHINSSSVLMPETTSCLLALKRKILRIRFSADSIAKVYVGFLFPTINEARRHHLEHIARMIVEVRALSADIKVIMRRYIR